MFWQASPWNNDLSPGLSKNLPLPFHNEDTVIYSLPLFCIYDCSISINQKFSGRKSWSCLYWFLTNFQTTFKDVHLHFCKSRLISLHPVGLCWIYTGVTDSSMTNRLTRTKRETDKHRRQLQMLYPAAKRRVLFQAGSILFQSLPHK